MYVIIFDGTYIKYLKHYFGPVGKLTPILLFFNDVHKLTNHSMFVNFFKE